MYASQKFFPIYFANASEKIMIANACANKFDYTSLPLKILDLGCHDGGLMSLILSSYPNLDKQPINLTGIDPELCALNQFKQRSFGENVICNTYLGTAEEFFLNNTDKYDWIIASQCLYWSDNLADILQQISQSSHASLIVLRDRSGIYEIQSRFKHLLGNSREKLYVADNIESALKKLNLPFERNCLQTTINIPQLEDEIRSLVYFLLQIQDGKLNEYDYAEVKNYLIKNHPKIIRHDISLFWLGTVTRG